MSKKPIIKQPDIKDNFIATLNKMGYMFIEPENFMQSFIDFSAQCSGPVLDIGAAYGVATIPALEKGAYVVANDMDEHHLEILQSKVATPLLSHLELKVGRMPSDINFPENHFGAILASRILNFIEPGLLKESFSLIHKWLKPEGKFFYLGATPFMGTFRRFLPQYEENRKNNKEWPGFIENIAAYVPEGRNQDLPQFINLIDEDILRKLMEGVNLTIEKMDYIPAEEAHPEDMKLDGREHLGIIAIKPQPFPLEESA